MEIHTKDKDFREHLEDSVKAIDKKDARKWSEYELRLVVQDEMSALRDEMAKLGEIA